MKLKRLFPSIILMCLLIAVCGNISLIFADYSEDLVIELDRTEAYPSQDVSITVYYRITFSEGESYDIGSKIIDMEITTSGLVDLIETNDYLLFPLIGNPAVSGRLYEACNVEIHIPDDHGDYGVDEKTYDVTIDNLRDYCNVVRLKVLAVKEELSVELDKTRAKPGDNVSISVKYTLDAPSNVILVRPLNFLSIDLDGILEDVVPPLSFPGEVTGGQEVTIASYKLQIPDNAPTKSYAIRAFGNPPNLQSDPVNLDLSGSPQIPSGGIPIFSRWELWAGITLAGSAIGGGYAVGKWTKKKQKIPSRGSKQLLVSNPIEGKGWRIAELNPDRSIKEGTERTLTDDEVEQIKRVTRVIDGSEYDDLEWTDPKTGETITWRGPDEIISPPPKPVQTPKVPTSKTTKSGKVDKKKTKKTKPKVATTKSKKGVKPTVTSTVPPSAIPPPVVSSKPPQTKVKPKMSKWEKKLQGGIDMVNNSVKGDKRIQKALEKYKGRRIVIDVLGESSYGIDVGSDRLVMKRGVVAKKSDLYIQMSDKDMTGIFDILKRYQEYPEAYKKYKAHPYVMVEPEKVTKLDIIKELGSIVGLKGTQSWLEEDDSKKTIRGIGTKDVSFLAEIFAPKKTPKKPKE